MDFSVKKYMIIFAVVLLSVIAFFNMMPYVFTSLELETIENPISITFNNKTIDNEEEIEAIYTLICNGRLREDKLKIKVTYWWHNFEVVAKYEGYPNEGKNTITSGHIYNFDVTEDDIVSFEYFKNDSGKSKDYRVAYIKVEGIYDQLKR